MNESNNLSELLDNEEMEKEIKKDVPKYVDLLDKVRDSAGLAHE